MSSLILYSLAFTLLLISFIKDREKTETALTKGYKSFFKLLPTILPMMFFIGISLSILNPTIITKLLGYESGILGVILGLIIGSIAFMPSFVALPLGANLLAHGAGYPQIAGFISTLMAVGFITFPVESKYFGKKAAFLRNSLGILASIVFVLIIWSVMK